MPIVTLVYDEATVSKTDLKVLAEAVQDFVATSTRIPEVMLYTQLSEVSVHAQPIHIFVAMDAGSIENVEGLLTSLHEKISAWKQASHFLHPMMLTLESKNWKHEKGI